MDDVDATFLSRLLDQHGASLVLYARQWCNSPEDVVQEAILRLMRQCPKPENEVGWLYRVVRNRAISAARAAGRRTRYEQAASSERQSWFVVSPDNAIDALAAAEALELLPIEQREAIVLRLWSGLSFEEIAELIGKSTSTAHRRYLAGLAALREQWTSACPSKESESL